MTSANPIGVEFGAVYELTGPDGTRAVLNNPADPDFAGFLTGDDAVTGLERAGVRESADSIPEADGGAHGAFYYERLAFTLKGIIPPDPRPEAGEYTDVDDVATTNLLTRPSGGTTVGTTSSGWSSSSNATRAFGGVATSGGYYVRATAINAGITYGPYRVTAANEIPVTPGKTYTFAFDLLAASVANRGVYAQLQWRDPGNIIKTDAGLPVSTSATAQGTQRVTGYVTATAPAGCSILRLYVLSDEADEASVVAGETFDVARFSFYEGPYVGTFDGSSPGAEWIGTPELGTSRTYAALVNELVNPRMDPSLGGWASNSGSGYYTGSGGFVSPPVTTSNAHYITPTSSPSAAASSLLARVYEGSTFSAAVTVVAAVTGRYAISLRDSNSGVVAYADGTGTFGALLEAGVPQTFTWTGITQTVRGNGVSPRFAVYRRNAAGTANQNLVAGEAMEYRDAIFVRGASLRGFPAFSGRDADTIVGRRTAIEGGPLNTTGRSYLVTYARTPLPETLVWARRQDRLKVATNAMRADATLKWTPSNGVPVQVSFRQQQPTRIGGRRPKTFLVAGVAERNVVESQAVASVDLPLSGAVAGGLVSPLVSPLRSNAATLGAGAAVNVGDSDAWPTITFTGPITNPSIRSLRYGLELRFIYSLLAGETLVINTDPRVRTILLNGTADRYDALDYLPSTWFPLAPGSNDLRVGADGYTTGAMARVEWRHAWG